MDRQRIENLLDDALRRAHFQRQRRRHPDRPTDNDENYEKNVKNI